MWPSKQPASEHNLVIHISILETPEITLIKVSSITKPGRISGKRPIPFNALNIGVLNINS